MGWKTFFLTISTQSNQYLIVMVAAKRQIRGMNTKSACSFAPFLPPSSLSCQQGHTHTCKTWPFKLLQKLKLLNSPDGDAYCALRNGYVFLQLCTPSGPCRSLPYSWLTVNVVQKKLYVQTGESGLTLCSYIQFKVFCQVSHWIRLNKVPSKTYEKKERCPKMKRYNLVYSLLRIIIA